MSLWDANLSELAQACADAGHRPLDRDHVLTCAVDACRELCEVYENTVTIEERDEEVDEIERERDEALRATEEAQKERDEAQKERDEAQEERAKAEAALETMTAECERLSEALEGDAGSIAQSMLEARQEAREARDALFELKRELAGKMRAWASHLDRKGSKKDGVIRGLRMTASELEE